MAMDPERPEMDFSDSSRPPLAALQAPHFWVPRFLAEGMRRAPEHQSVSCESQNSASKSETCGPLG